MIDYTLTQASDVKEALNITSSTYDTLLQKLVYGVSEFLQGYCNRNFKEQTITEYYDGETLGKDLVLRSFPVASITSIAYKSGTPTAPIWNTINADTYELDTVAGIVRHYGLPKGFQNIKVVYVAGYKIDFANRYTAANHTLPHDLSMVATQLVSKIFDTRFSQGKINESVEGQSVNWTMALTDEQKKILGKYQVSHL